MNSPVVRRPIPLLLLALTVTSPALAAKDPLSLTEDEVQHFRDLTKEAMERYKAKDWEGAIASFTVQDTIYDRSDDALYNLTCVQALARKKDDALGSLARAIEAGFTDVEHMRGDSDLDAIRLDARFDGLMKRAEELASAPAADPFAAKGAAGPSFGSVDELERHVAARVDAFERVRPILGTFHARELRIAMARDAVAAWDAFGAAHPESLEQSRHGAIVAMGSVDAPSPTRDRAIDAFLAAHPKSAHAVEVRFAKAQSAAAAIDVVDEESQGRAMDILMTAAREITAASPELADGGGAGSTEMREIVFWAYRDARNRRDAAAARRLYLGLKKGWAEDPAFFEDHAYEFFEEKIADGVPSFDVKGIEGQVMSLQNARGKVTLLDFWATWCRPCVKEVPHLKEAYEKFHEKGFEIYGISADRPEDTTVDDLKAWVKEKGMTWPQYYEPADAQSKLVTLFGIEGFPTTILLDRDGSVVAVNLRGQELVDRVGKLVAEKSGS